MSPADRRRISVEWRRPADLHHDPGNPRTHPPAQVAEIAASIRAFGFNNPILLDGDGMIVAGEGRLLAARDLALAEVPVIVLGHLSGSARRAFQVADNRIALNAGWDEALLAQVLADLDATDIALPALGFTDEELENLLSPLGTGEGLTEDAAAPPPPVDPVSRLGDLWILGTHRLVCGDSTKAATITRVMDDPAPSPAALVFTDPPYGMAYDGGRAMKSRAALVFTDPPYGMAFGAGKAAGSTKKGALVKAHGAILGDGVAGDALVRLVMDVLLACRAASREDAAAYICFTWRTYAEFLAAVTGAGLTAAACIVWNKGSIGLGHQHYRPQHEFIFYCPGRTWRGGRGEADVWTIPRDNRAAYVHPTQKPVALASRAIGNSSAQGDAVLDPFGGSGTTVIACEKLGRHARLVELDPKYCDVIVRRWQAFIGREATLGAAGPAFARVAAARKDNR